MTVLKQLDICCKELLPNIFLALYPPFSLYSLAVGGVSIDTQRLKAITESDKDRAVFIRMPPTGDQLDASKAIEMVKEKIKTHKVMMFSKSYCPYCIRVSITLFLFNSERRSFISTE